MVVFYECVFVVGFDGIGDELCEIDLGIGIGVDVVGGFSEFLKCVVFEVGENDGVVFVFNEIVGVVGNYGVLSGVDVEVDDLDVFFFLIVW